MCMHSYIQNIMHQHEHIKHTYTHTPPQSTYAYLNTRHASPLGCGWTHTWVPHLRMHTHTYTHTHTAQLKQEYYAVVLSNTLCKNMNTLHRHLSTEHLYNYIDTPANAVRRHVVVKCARACTWDNVTRRIMPTVPQANYTQDPHKHAFFKSIMCSQVTHACIVSAACREGPGLKSLKIHKCEIICANPLESLWFILKP